MKNSKQGFIPIILSKLGFLSFILPLPPLPGLRKISQSIIQKQKNRPNNELNPKS
ncbi:hypothetical protein [Niallia hominis]|uniref:Uncharacterized protein n=1 Tax=Niallia hominis TaxID=3133173 RepID=A0ABV1F157_9BACI